MRTPDFRTQLRGAVYRGDGHAVVALLRDTDLPDDALQLVGDGLLAALGQHIDGAAGLAGACERALRERRWDGDQELAEQLQALLGTGATPLLRSKPVDLEELSGVLEGDPAYGGGRIDLQTGRIWPQELIDDDEDDEGESDDPDRWLWVDSKGSRDGFRDMVEFVGTVDDPDRADRLSIALDGRGAFRRFKDVLARWQGELDRWHGFAEDRQRGRARAWLADAGYRPSPLGHPPPAG